MHRIQMCFVINLACYSLNVMIIREIVEVKSPAACHVLQTLDCMGYLKIIVLIVSRIKGFMQSIIGYTVKCGIIDPA